MLKTDGMDKDPISGNDIPVGSTAKEVRDDVDAKLSEGEYVLPADVVRYFGLEKIEGMVNAAKEGINEMDANGRIGGDPVPAEGDELLEQADQFFNAGGMVRGGAGLQGTNRAIDTGMMLDQAKVRAAKDPEFAALLKSKGISIQGADKVTPQVNNMGMPVQMNKGGMVTGYAEGGDVFGQTPYNPAAFRSSFNPYTYHPGYSTLTNASGQAPGQPLAPQTPTADPATMCGPGTVWDAEKNMCVPVNVEQPRNDDDGPSQPTHDPEAWMKKYDYTDPNILMEQTLTTLGAGSEKEEEKGAKGILGKIGGFLGDALGGGMLGGIIKNQKYAEAMANAEVLRSHGMTEQADAISKAAAQYAGDNDLNLGGFFDSTKTLTKTALGKYGKTFGMETPAAKPTTTVTPTTKVTPTTTTGTPSSRLDTKGLVPKVDKTPKKNNDDDGGPSHAEIMERHYGSSAGPASVETKAAQMSAVRQAGVPTNVAAQMSGSQMEAGTEVGTGAKGTNRVGPMNKGGLVQRRKKNKK